MADEILSLSIDGDAAVNLEGRVLGDVVIAALALLLLELNGDTTDGALLDAAHKVRGEASNLVAEALSGDGSDLLDEALVGLEVGAQAGVVLLNDDLRGLLDGLGANATLWSRD